MFEYLLFLSIAIAVILMARDTRQPADMDMPEADREARIEELRKHLVGQPGDVDALLELGVHYGNLGRQDDAETAYWGALNAVAAECHQQHLELWGLITDGGDPEGQDGGKTEKESEEDHNYHRELLRLGEPDWNELPQLLGKKGYLDAALDAYVACLRSRDEPPPREGGNNWLDWLVYQLGVPVDEKWGFLKERGLPNDNWDIGDTPRGDFANALMQWAHYIVMADGCDYDPELAVKVCDKAIEMVPWATPSVLWTRARAYASMSKYNEAIRDWTSVINDPGGCDDEICWQERRRCCRRAEDWQELVRICSDDLENCWGLSPAQSGPDSPLTPEERAAHLERQAPWRLYDAEEILEARAEAATETGEYALAIADYSTLSALNPDGTHHLEMRADVYARAGMTEAALRDYDAVTGVAARSGQLCRAASLHLKVGELFAQADDSRRTRFHLDAALECYSQMMEREPQYFGVYSERADTYVAIADRFPQGMSGIDEVTALRRAAADYSQAIARAEMEMQACSQREPDGDWIDRSVEAFGSGRPIDATGPDSQRERYRKRAQTWERLGEHEKAIADWTEIVMSISDDPSGRRERAQIWERLGEHEKAIADWTEILMSISDDPSGRWERAKVNAFNLQDYPAAIDDLTYLIELPDLAYASENYRVRGYCHHEMGSYDLAIYDFTTALAFLRDARAPDDESLIRWQRAKSWIKNGDLDFAQADLAWATCLAPDDYVYHLDHALVLANMGCEDEARAAMEIVRQFAPPDAVHSIEGALARARADIDLRSSIEAVRSAVEDAMQAYPERKQLGGDCDALRRHIEQINAMPSASGRCRFWETNRSRTLLAQLPSRIAFDEGSFQVFVSDLYQIVCECTGGGGSWLGELLDDQEQKPLHTLRRLRNWYVHDPDTDRDETRRQWIPQLVKADLEALAGCVAPELPRDFALAQRALLREMNTMLAAAERRLRGEK